MVIRGCIALCCCLLASPAYAAITEVASQRADATGCIGTDTCAVAFPNNVTAGNLLIVGGSGADEDSGPGTYTVTDTVGTTYTTLLCTTVPTQAGFESTAFLAYGIAAGSGANTVTVNPTLDTSVQQMDFAIDEFTGVADPPLDVDGGSSTGTSTTPADGITTLTANDLVIGVVGIGTITGPTLTPGSGYTQIGESQSGGDGFNFEFQIVTTAQLYSVNWTSTNILWSACTAAFKEAVAASILQSPPLPPILFQ